MQNDECTFVQWFVCIHAGGCAWAPPAFLEGGGGGGGGQDRARGAPFDSREYVVVVRFRPIQPGGGGGGGGGGGWCCPLSADLTSGGGGGGGCRLLTDLTSGGGGGCCLLSADSISEVSALSATISGWRVLSTFSAHVCKLLLQAGGGGGAPFKMEYGFFVNVTKRKSF